MINMMTIQQIADKIIKEIKAFPEEARQSQNEGGPKTSWDEYKEQVQYEEYDSFEIFQETIESMVDDEISELSDEDVEQLYSSLNNDSYLASDQEMREGITESVLSYIESEAQTEDIEYEKPNIEFIKYRVERISIIAEVIKKVSPEEYLIHAYSNATGISGEQGLVNLAALDEENGLVRLSEPEFVRMKNRLKGSSVVVNNTREIVNQDKTSVNVHPAANLKVDEDCNKNLQRDDNVAAVNKGEIDGQHDIEWEQIKKSIEQVAILLAKVQKKTPIEIIREMKYDLEQMRLQQDQKTPKQKEAIVTSPCKTGKLDPELLISGITLTEFHIEAGTKKFNDYARVMVFDLGEAIKPYLKPLYNAVRDWPGFNVEGMDTYEDVSMADVEKVLL